MKAKVIREFKGVRDGQIYPETIRVGEEIEGDLAECAIAQGDAKPVKKRRKAPTPDHKKDS